MDRYNFEEHISAYIDGELSQEDKRKFEELINNDENCKKRYNEMSQIVSNLSLLPKLETDNNFINNLNQKIDNYEKSNISILEKLKKYFTLSSEQEKLRAGFLRPVMGIAMSCAAFLMVFYLSSNNSNVNSSIVSNPSDLGDDIYYSDIDSTDSEQYENEIQLTKGLDERD
tara:strand:- start:9853 stop:10365 length:513 start_codon:yes stop_codon:yes gene_type:complete